MKALEAIRVRAKAYAEHGTPGLAAPQDRKELLRIVDAVEKVLCDMDHADWCDFYHGSEGECRCWQSYIEEALSGKP